MIEMMKNFIPGTILGKSDKKRQTKFIRIKTQATQKSTFIDGVKSL